MHNFRGFTLVELMVTLVVAAILIAIAAPSLGQFIRENRAATQANNVLASIQLARSEAINRNLQVIMRNSGTDNVWEDGWTVFTDWNANGNFNGNADDKDCSIEDQECLLFVQEALPDGITLRTRPGGPLAVGLVFLPSGELRSLGGGFANDTFSLLVPGADERCIRIAGSRPRIGAGDECQ